MKIKKRVAIIDADTDIFAIASRNQIDMPDGEASLPTKSVEDCLRMLRAKWEEQEDILSADMLMLMLTHPKNWRTKILPSYKGNRKSKEKPVLLQPIRKALLSGDFPLTTKIVPWLEADDLCGITSTLFQKQGKHVPIIVSQDKDLSTIPGLLWNPRPTPRGGRREIEVITEQEAFMNHMFQSITGDTTDNYKGCKGMGPVKTKTFLKEREDLSRAELWEEIVELFREKGHEDGDALVNAQVARIMHCEDWVDKKVIPWIPPKK